MAEERQSVLGWPVAIELFLSGTGGAIFLISFVLDVLGEYIPVVKVGAVSGPVLAGAGSLFLIAELSSKANIYRLFSNPSSWMSRGAWILTGFILFGLSYSLPDLWIAWSMVSPGRGIGIVAALFAIATVVYPGFLLGSAKSIPFWNTPALPLTFLLSSLCAGVAGLLLIASIYAGSMVGDTVFLVHSLGMVAVILIVMQLLLLGFYLEIGRHSSICFARSVHLFMTALPTGTAVVVGLIIPLGLLFFSLTVSDVFVLSIWSTIISVFVLVGGLFLRYSVIGAGLHLRTSIFEPGTQRGSSSIIPLAPNNYGKQFKDK